MLTAALGVRFSATADFEEAVPSRDAMIDWPLSNPSSAPAWFGEVLRQCTRSLANASGWPLSHAWARDSTGEHLVSSGIWHPELGAEFLPWRQALASATFKRGIGLPGKVWQARAALATTDTCDALPALDAELAPRRAVAFPVICADEVVAVMGLFTATHGPTTGP